MNVITLGIEHFVDPTKGKAIASGNVYVGEPDTDPEVVANQKTVTLRQEDGTEVATSQPVTLSAGGVPVYNGSPVQILVDGNYSLKITNSLGAQIYYIPNWNNINVISGEVTAEDYTELRGFTGADAAFVNVISRTTLGDNGGGSFYWDASDLSASVTADTLSGIYVAPDSDPTGASGAWVRDYSGLVNPLWFGLNADGTTDDRDILAAADSFGDTFIDSGTVSIQSDLTLSNKIEILNGSLLKPGTNVTLTISGGLEAEDERIFDLSTSGSAISGLEEVRLNWFAGHLLDTATDSLALLQKGYDACQARGNVYWPVGKYSITGATAIDVSKGQKTIGVGKFLSRLAFTTSTCNGFDINTTVSAEIHNIRVGMPDYTTYPTAGIAINVDAGYVYINSVVVDTAYIGIEYTSNSGPAKTENFDVLDCANIGVHCHDLSDVYFDTFTIVAAFDRFALSSVVGTFVVGETVTGGTSGATATIGTVISSTVIRAQSATINFTIGETITGGTSGATAVVDSQTVNHLLGGMRLFDKTEAVIVVNGDIIGGKFPLALDSSVYAVGVRPAYCRFTNVYFDSADEGVLIDNSVDISFVNCWFSNRPSFGCEIVVADSIRFNGCSFINSWLEGLQIQSTAQNTIVDGCTISGNNASGGSSVGINIEANTNDFVITSNRIGGTLGFGTQDFGVVVNAGTSDRYIISGNLVSGNTSGGVSDGGSGVNKTVANNY